MGMGTGSFCAAASFGAASSPTSICSADFNGDGLRDLAVTNNNSNNVSILLNCTSVPLPVELISFSAEQTGSSVSLAWTTATELNNDYFTVERSTDGTGYEQIAKVKGAGNSSQEIQYSTSDEKPVEGVNYYRLKQTDFNGRYEYSPVVAVPVSHAGEFAVFPNPGTGIFFVSSPAEITAIEVYDAFGERVFFEWMPSSPTIDLSGRPNGLYFVTIRTEKESFTEKVVIQE